MGGKWDHSLQKAAKLGAEENTHLSSCFSLVVYVLWSSIPESLASRTNSILKNILTSVNALVITFYT